MAIGSPGELDIIQHTCLHIVNEISHCVWEMRLLTFPAILICHECGKYWVHACCHQEITVEVAAYDQPDYCREWVSMDSCHFQREDRFFVSLPRVAMPSKCKYKMNG
jgi:hypothetical protein